jgi:hypothetical protein
VPQKIGGRLEKTDTTCPCNALLNSAFEKSDLPDTLLGKGKILFGPFWLGSP